MPTSVGRVAARSLRLPRLVLGTRGVGERVVAAEITTLRQLLAREVLPFVVLPGPGDARLREAGGYDHRAVVVRDHDVAGNDRHAAARDRAVDGERHEVGLRVEVRRHAPDPQRHAELPDVWPVA